MTLEYWKEYPTFFQMSLIYKISPSSCYRNVCWVEDNLANHQDFQTLKNKINKKENLNKWQIYLIDATEIKIEKPKYKQRQWFSGKTWMHSIKFQIMYDIFDNTIVDVFSDKGKVHDFQILKNSNLKFSEKTIIIGDLGYQGLQKIHKNTLLPLKKTKNKKLTKQEKSYNKIIYKIRIKIESVFQWLKRFKILVNKCRKSRLRLMYLRFNLLCEIFNKIKPFKNVN